MKIAETAKLLFQYGGTIIMAALFIWVFIQDRNKTINLQEDNHRMLELLTQNSQTLTESNNNIAKSLDIISNNLTKINDKADRNYAEIVKK